MILPEQAVAGYMRKKVCFILTICWMIVIFSFSAREASLSSQDSASVGVLLGRIFVPGFEEWDQKVQMAFADQVDHPVRKTAHVTEYAVLGIFITGSFFDRKKKRWNAICVPWLAGTVYAVTDELHQMFVPGRSCELTDMMIDSCGVLAGVLAGLLLWRKIIN